MVDTKPESGTKNDLELLREAGLDFEVKCQAVDRQYLVLFGLLLQAGPSIPCVHVARWVARCRSCGFESYICDEHRATEANRHQRLWCAKCGLNGRSDEVWDWKPIPPMGGR